MAASTISSTASTPAPAPKAAATASLSDASNADLTLALLGHLIELVDHVATMVPATAGLANHVRLMTNAFKALKDSIHPPPPSNLEVPYAALDGTTLTCTMGTWENEPTSYTYSWSNGATGASYTIVAADAGTSVTCVVTATNAAGSAAAPASNAVAIPAA